MSALKTYRKLQIFAALGIPIYIALGSRRNRYDSVENTAPSVLTKNLQVIEPKIESNPGSGSELLYRNSTADTKSGSFILSESDLKLQPPTIVNGLRLAFLGDSVTRFQYLSLVRYLHYGEWEPPVSVQSIVEKVTIGFSSNTKDDWGHVIEYATNLLAPNLQCDCSMNEVACKSPPCLRMHTMNWYYHDPKNDNVVIYLQKMGDSPFLGNWNPKDIFERDRILQKADYSFNTNYAPDAWNYTWAQGISDHLGKLDPKFKPRHAVFNQGLWKHDLEDQSVQDAIVNALMDTGIKGIYKTTAWKKRETVRKREKHGNLFHYERDICRKLGKGGCLDLSWTFNVTTSIQYYDDIHFKEPIYRVMNEQLLSILGYEFDFKKPSYCGCLACTDISMQFKNYSFTCGDHLEYVSQNRTSRGGTFFGKACTSAVKELKCPTECDPQTCMLSR